MGREEKRDAAARAVRLRVPATAEYVLLPRLALAAVCRPTPLEEEAIADLKLAVTEAATGLLGSAESGDERITFSFHLSEDRVVVEVRGPGPVELAEQDLRRAILEATVDNYEVGDGTVTLVKLLDQPGG